MPVDVDGDQSLPVAIERRHSGRNVHYNALESRRRCGLEPKDEVPDRPDDKSFEGDSRRQGGSEQERLAQNWSEQQACCSQSKCKAEQLEWRHEREQRISRGAGRLVTLQVVNVSGIGMAVSRMGVRRLSVTGVAMSDTSAGMCRRDVVAAVKIVAARASITVTSMVCKPANCHPCQTHSAYGKRGQVYVHPLTLRHPVRRATSA